MLFPLLALLLLTSQERLELPPFDRGTELYHACQITRRILDKVHDAGSEDLPFASECISYIQGFIDGLDVSHPSICRNDSTIDAWIRTYVSYMDAHPDLLGQHKAIGLFSGLQAAYPCQPTLKNP